MARWTRGVRPECLLLFAGLFLVVAPHSAFSQDARSLAKSGQIEFKEGKLDRALADLEKAVATDPSVPEAWQWLGEVYAAYGRGSDARWAFQTALAKGSQAPEVHRGLGDALLLVGSVDSAGAEYRAALSVKPKMEEAQLGLGRVQFAQGNYDQALETFRLGEKKAKRRAPFYAWEGAALSAQGAAKRAAVDSLVAAGDTAAARASLEASRPLFAQADVAIRKALSLEPTSPDFKAMLGDMYLAQNVSESAVQAYTEATTLARNRADLLYKLGQAQRRDRNYTAAVQSFRQATEIDSSMAPAYFAMGQLYFLGDQYENAARALQKYVQLRPDDAGARIMLGDAFFRGRFYNEAIPALQQAVQIAPDSCRASLLLGDAYVFVGNTASGAARDSLYAQARDAYLGGLEHCPGGGTADVYLRVGKLSLAKKTSSDEERRKAYEDAVTYLSKAVAADSTNKEAVFRLGVAYFYQQKYDEAIPLFEHTIALDDSNGLAYLNLGEAYYSKNRWNDAISALGRADSLLAPADTSVTAPQPARSQAVMWEGLAYFQIKDYTTAVALLKRAIELDPGNTTAQKDLTIVQNRGSAAQSTQTKRSTTTVKRKK
jgi:tetratricopeptide (TPR) repeat protein